MNATIHSVVGAAGNDATGGGGLSASTPVLFLPVNVETRFVTSAAGASELWVRIYPDQIAIDAHEPELTQQEIADGQAYWNLIWRAGNPPTSLDAVKAPWRGLAQRYGSQRAAWIASQITPTNIGVQPVGATPDGATPDPAPVYPTVQTRAASWTKPAITEALPDRWTVVTVSGTTLSTFRGGPITQQLAVSLTPPATAFPPGSPVDPGMQWLVDFDQALAAGMALKIPLTSQQRASGFDRLFVYGLRSEAGAGAGDNSASGAHLLAALLDDHHYSDGLSLVPQGAPTNNTADASSFFSRKDPDFETSFAVERQKPLNSDPAADGNLLAASLGLDPTTMGHVRAADGFGARNGRDMLTALWPATLGYFLTQMMASVFSASQIETARQFVLAHALPRGPLPAISIGKTPYGVLPVTSLRRYPREASRLTGSLEPQLVQFILKLWPNWLNSSNAAPHMQNSGDPDAQLVGALGMDASSMSFRGRKVLGDDFLWNYGLFSGISAQSLNTWWTTHLAAGRKLLDDFGFNAWDPRVIHLGMEGGSFPVPFPTVQAGPLSETDALKADADLGAGAKGNYIQWLKQASVEDIQAENYPGPKPTSLFYKILRQSLILDYADLASQSEVGAGRLQVSQLREQEMVAVQPAPASAPALTTWEVLARPSIPNPALSWADFLVSFDPPPASPFARLAELRTSLDRLALLSTAELDRLLTETLDACSHRLDVWGSAVANAILQRQRTSQQATGLHLGGFGWVEEIRPSAQPAQIAGAELQDVEALDQRRAKRLQLKTLLPVPVQPSADNGGYILAPSLTQASVSAVLRNGYMTHKGTAEEGLLAIDLSSARVRKALTLLEGVQQGQSLNALLGYLFEDGLHGLSLDKYAQPFRDRFPIIANKLTPSSEPSESVAASNVVDGVALRAAWDTGQLPSGGNWGASLPGPGADQNGIISVLQGLDDYADALGDLSISEAVFQITRGNFGRAGTLLDAISKGQRPPKPDVVNTPRGGIDLTHRVAVLFAGNATVNPPWSSVGMHPRAAAEPWIDAWLSTLLPDPSLVTCTVTYSDAGGNPGTPVAVSLHDLDVQTQDVLAMAGVGSTPQRGELELRILFAAALPPGATKVAIDFAAAAGNISFPDAMYLAQSLRNLVSSARALAPQDLTVPEVDAATVGGAIDLADLRSRASAAVASLQGDLTALTTAVGGLPAAPNPVRAALMRASYYGIQGAIPLVSAGPDASLADRGASVAKLLQDRLTKASTITIATAPSADLTKLFGILFGDDFVVLPRFTPPDFAALQSAFGQSAALVAGDTQALARWLTQLTHVRPGVSRLDSAYSLAQLLGASTADPSALLLGQLPQTPGDKWLGLGITPTSPPAKGRVAFACLTGGDPLTQASYAGLMIEEWPERIPSVQENAAVAFHYEEPKARAPQALLLAVCPDSRPFWDDDLVLGILQETLELAKIRAVDLDSVAEVGQILPALYFALNLQGATVSTNFATFKEYSRVAQDLR
ncbi:MAG TPA: hypothetical protein VGM84_25265 [Steroidobacteraceae bacterium]|jgi:hypothetical protein